MWILFLVLFLLILVILVTNIFVVQQSKAYVTPVDVNVTV